MRDGTLRRRGVQGDTNVGGTAIELEEFRLALAAADPSAILVPDRILRRVIKHDRGLTWLGGARPKCHVMPGAALGAIVDAAELGRPADLAWPATALLIAQPEPDELADERPRAHPDGSVAAALPRAGRVRAGALVRVGSRSTQRGSMHGSAAIGRTEFEEARAVLRQDGLLLPPESDATAYAAFAAVFLELSYLRAGVAVDRSSRRSSRRPPSRRCWPGTSTGARSSPRPGRPVRRTRAPRPIDPTAGLNDSRHPVAGESRVARYEARTAIGPWQGWPTGPGRPPSGATMSGRRSSGRDRPGGPGPEAGLSRAGRGPGRAQAARRPAAQGPLRPEGRIEPLGRRR